VSKKRENPIRVKVGEIQVTDLDLSSRCNEAKQKDHGVAIAVNGMRAHSSEARKMIGEIVPQRGSESVWRRLH
jgi:hypothetical protein